MAIFLIVALKDGRRWLASHAYAGPAIFLSEEDAGRHVDATRASGVAYSIVAIPTNQMRDLP